jgi:hypothetical protein
MILRFWCFYGAIQMALTALNSIMVWSALCKLTMLSSLFITFAKKLDSLYTCLNSSQCGQAFCTLRALYGNAQPYMFLHFFAMGG